MRGGDGDGEEKRHRHGDGERRRREGLPPSPSAAVFAPSGDAVLAHRRIGRGESPQADLPPLTIELPEVLTKAIFCAWA